MAFVFGGLRLSLLPRLRDGRWRLTQHGPFDHGELIVGGDGLRNVHSGCETTFAISDHRVGGHGDNRNVVHCRFRLGLTMLSREAAKSARASAEMPLLSNRRDLWRG